MISSAIRHASKACCLVIIVSFLLFTVDEMRNASRESTVKLGNATAVQVYRDSHGRDVSRQGNRIRARIDGISDSLTAPIEDAVGKRDPWVMRVVPFAVGLFFYGFMLSFFARWVAMITRPAPPVRAFRPGY